MVIFLNHNCIHRHKKKSKFLPAKRDIQVLKSGHHEGPTDTFHVATNSNCLRHSKRVTSVQPVTGTSVPCHGREHAEKNTAARPAAVWPVTHAVCH